MRGPAGEPLEVRSESDSKMRVQGGFDLLPWNGRQLVRDKAGNWLLLISPNGKEIVLAGGGPSANPYRPRGGDFVSLELVGGGDALFPGGEGVSRPSMVVAGDNRLYVVWHNHAGLWHASARLAGGGIASLRRRSAWSEPRRLVEKPCRSGDILCDARGAVAVSYAMAGAVPRPARRGVGDLAKHQPPLGFLRALDG